MIWILLVALWLGLHVGLRRRRPGPCLIIGHRGAARHAPENTLSGLERGLALGARALEIDFQSCRGGDLAVIHDATVDRTTNGTGAVRDLTLSHLKNLDAGGWFDASFAGEPLPALPEVLDWADGRGLPLVLEMKSQDSYVGVIEQVAAFLDRSGQGREHVVIAFDPRFLTELAGIRPQIRMGQLSSGNIWRKLPSHVDLVDIHWTVPLFDPTFLARMRAQDKKVWVWTLDNRILGRMLMWLGVDGLTTNAPDRFRP